jgi:ferric-dicitrate binding protein FerR (iron transport regulator)
VTPSGRWLEDAREEGPRAVRAALDESERFVASDVRARRVWARLQPRLLAPAPARPPGRRYTAVLGLAVASMLLGGLAVWRFAALPDDATLAQGAPAAGNHALAGEHPEAELVVRPADGAEIVRTLAGGAVAALGPRSALAIDGDGRPEVREGRVRFDVPRQPAGSRFAVSAGGVRIVVIGTRFVVGVRDGTAEVEVEEGTVEVWGAGGKAVRLARLERGERWPEAAAAPATPVRVPPRPSARPARVAPGVEPPAGSVDLVRQARGEADPARALALYERAARGQGPEAENALYEAGLLLRDRMQDPAGAIARWRRYRDRFPGGRLRPEADLSIVETLARTGQAAPALAEATAFLARHPHSERRAEIARVAGDLARAAGDCARALPHYREAARGGAADRDAAAFGTAACAQGPGEPEASLARYLRDWPTGRHAAEARRLLSGAPRR